MSTSKKQVSLVQAILTGVGLVIGSGIFFRADNILEATKGNALIAILGWLFVGATLVFAGLTIAVLASRTKRSGGFIAYAEDTYGPKFAYAVGWFQIAIYNPAMVGVLGIIAAGYMIQLFGWEMTINQEYMLAFAIIAACYGWNLLSTRIGAMFSSAATIIKLIPLLVVGVMGIFFSGNVGSEASEMLTQFSKLTNNSVGMLTLFIAPMLSMAFAFDGWITIGTLSEDMEKPERDLPKVFTINMIIVTFVYVFYFTAITMLMPAEEIIKLGNDHVGIIAKNLFGQWGMSFILTGVVISVLGTLNGNVMAGMRYVEAMGQKGVIKNSEFFAKRNESTQTPINGSYLVIVTSLILFFLYYSQKAFEWFDGIAFDDLPIMLNAVFYLALFFAVIKIGQRENLGVKKTWIYPLIAILGQILVIASFTKTNDKALLYIVLSAIVILLGFVFRTKSKNNA